MIALALIAVEDLPELTDDGVELLQARPEGIALQTGQLAQAHVEDRVGLDVAEPLGAAGEAARPDWADVVAICTPNHTHYPIARALLEAGFDVICEKPLVDSVAANMNMLRVWGGGIYVIGPDPLAEGTTVDVVIGPPRERYRFTGVVMWTRHSGARTGFGIRFSAVPLLRSITPRGHTIVTDFSPAA